jgi:histidinol dehydrogenase
MIRRLDLASMSASERRALLSRSAVPSNDVLGRAAAIVEEVRRGGDAALTDAGRSLGGGRNGSARVTAAEIAASVDRVDSELVSALREAAGNVAAVCRDQRPTNATVEVRPGVEVARYWAPLRRVGCYVPGGSAPLPSTLIMTVVPAQVAGVPSIAVATPARPDGTIADVVLAAAALLGIDEVYAMGGAQAIAALAYGTETIEPVDKIVGPGNVWVTAAKLSVAGSCAIDMPAGPSEALVLADESANPAYVAADLLAQAEHGPDSPVLLVTADSSVADRVVAEAMRQLQQLGRRDVVEQALAEHGLVAVASDLEQALAFADDYAPEHLTIHLADPEVAVERITSAGSVFVGAWAPEPVGDYASGANHVLPTGGLACSTGPLSVEDFGSWRQVQRLTREGLAALRPVVRQIATAEGLDAHLAAVEVRFDGEGEQ